MPQSITVIGWEEIISQENLQFYALNFPFLSPEQAYNKKKLYAIVILIESTTDRRTGPLFMKYTKHCTQQ